MRCYICGKFINFRRTIKTLFTIEPVFRCQACQRKYQVLKTTQVIPKEKGLIYLTSLFNEKNDHLFIAYNEEVAKWFLTTLNEMGKDDLILWFEKIDIEEIELLDEVYGNIYILVKTILII